MNDSLEKQSQYRIEVYELIRKEVDIYVAQRNTFSIYAQDWVSKIFLDLTPLIEKRQSKSYLKGAIKNKLAQEMRNIIEPTRYSPLQMLAHFPTEDEDMNRDEVASYNILKDETTSQSPLEIIAQNDMFKGLRNSIEKLDSADALLIESFARGCSLREIAFDHSLSKSTVVRRLNVIFDTLRPSLFEFR